jgi:hypothetical protein
LSWNIGTDWHSIQCKQNCWFLSEICETNLQFGTYTTMNAFWAGCKGKIQQGSHSSVFVYLTCTFSKKNSARKSLKVELGESQLKLLTIKKKKQKMLNSEDMNTEHSKCLVFSPHTGKEYFS